MDVGTHRSFLRGFATGSASFLQTPGWAAVKREWSAESLGWYDQDRLVGVALVLFRRLPRSTRALAYVPEGPVLDWQAHDVASVLTPLADHLREQRAFAIRIGPPVVIRRWSAAQVKAGIADDAIPGLGALDPTSSNDRGVDLIAGLARAGWRLQSADGGFAAGQPQFNFQIPLVDEAGAARDEESVLASMNQLWRRNIKKAAKAGVEVTRGGIDDLKDFHDLYVHTAERDHFTPRPLSYFETMFAALDDADPETGADCEIRLYLARHEDDLVAATIWIRSGRHVWYSYGASSTEKREVRGSNAAQWQMIRDAIACGAHVYDLRGITETLDADDPHVGLIQFKVGTGGEAVEYAGEWDLPLNRLLYKGFQTYMNRRG
ncbi:MAG TPA: peptidoglycan bridge formation glycyltransferase FemA/FemB family protein [Marmoricola sp.]